MKKVTKAGRGELVFASSLLLLGIYVLYDTMKMEVPDGIAIVSPRLFPYFVGTFLIVVSAGLILTILRGNLAVPEGTEPGDPFVPADFKTMSLVVAGIAGHVILLEKLGYGQYCRIHPQWHHKGCSEYVFACQSSVLQV